MRNNNFEDIKINEVNANLKIGNYEKAALKLIEMYNINNNEEYLFRAALIYHQNKYFLKAMELYEILIKSSDKIIKCNAYNNMASIYKNDGNFEKTIAAYEAAINSNRENGLSYYNLAVTLQNNNKIDEAIKNYESAEKLNYIKEELYLNLGNAYLHKNLEKAIEYYNKVIKINDKNYLSYYNRGLAFQKMERYNESILDYKNAIKLNKNFINTYLNLGVCYKKINKIDEAIKIYKKGLNLNENDYLLNYNLGAEYKEIEDFSLAIKHTSLAIKNNKKSFEAYSNLGNIYLEMRQFNKAFESYNEGLKLNNEYDIIWYNYGRAMQTISQNNEAIKYYKKAVELNYQNNQAKLNMATCYENVLQHDEAFLILKNLINEFPEFKAAYSNLLFLINYHPNLNQHEIKKNYDFVKDKIYSNKKINKKLFSNRINRKLRIGFVSADFKKSSVSNFTQNVFEKIDKTKFELYAYVENKKEDEVSNKLKKYFKLWNKIYGLSTSEVVKNIEDNKIDILFDLSGHTSNNRLEVFAHRPALVSITWLGYGYTTGLSEIDYYITGPESIDHKDEIFFSEKIWRLKTAQASFRADPDSGPISTLPFEENGYITYGCLSRSVRLNHKLIEVWSIILKRTKNSKLILNSRDFQDNILKSYILKLFNDFGIENERVEIGYDTPPWNTYRKIDVMLDCFPHNSGTTLMESLYMGIPFVTLRSRPTVGTIGSSILSVINKKSWIASDYDEYINIAVDFNKNIDLLKIERKMLRSLVESSDLMNSENLVAELENDLLKMFDINFRRQDF